MFCSALGLMRLSGACYFRKVQVKSDGTGPEGFFDLLIGAKGTEINYNYILPSCIGEGQCCGKFCSVVRHLSF